MNIIDKTMSVIDFSSCYILSTVVTSGLDHIT